MNGDIFNGLGDFLISDSRKDLNESTLKDAEIQRQLNEQLIEQLKNKKAMYSGDNQIDNKKYYILGGVALMMVVALILVK